MVLCVVDVGRKSSTIEVEEEEAASSSGVGGARRRRQARARSPPPALLDASHARFNRAHTHTLKHALLPSLLRQTVRDRHPHQRRKSCDREHAIAAAEHNASAFNRARGVTLSLSSHPQQHPIKRSVLPDQRPHRPRPHLSVFPPSRRARHDPSAAPARRRRRRRPTPPQQTPNHVVGSSPRKEPALEASRGL